jgi:hypothetical protein
MKSKIWLIAFFILQYVGVFSQSVSTSPYSIYGLGSLYESDFGSIPSIGSSGIALPSTSFINNKNPASLGHIGKYSFFFDTGLKGIQTTYESVNAREKRNNFQFSHIAIAFAINPKSGVSVSLKPYSSATYLISNYELPINNSDESYFLDAKSSGGINTFDLSYGYKAHKKLSFGLTTSFYFGNINDNKDFTIANSITNINKKSFYQGVRLTLGNQIKIDSTLNIGITLKSPAQLAASKTQSITTVNTTQTDNLETAADSDVTDYYLPFAFAVGFSKTFKKNFNLTFDYEKSLWNGTNQTNLYGEFKNQDKYALGLSFIKKKRSIYFSDRIQYFTGLSYDTGFISIDNNYVNNLAFSMGVGIPVDNTKSLLNITYSYGQKGSVSSDLIKENYHKIGFNFSFESIWFVKRKFE